MSHGGAYANVKYTFHAPSAINYINISGMEQTGRNRKISFLFECFCVFFSTVYSEMKSSKPEPGEVSPLHSSTSSKKEDSLRRGKESRELNDSEEEGDLLEDEDEVRTGGKGKEDISSCFKQVVVCT